MSTCLQGSNKDMAAPVTANAVKMGYTNSSCGPPSLEPPHQPSPTGMLCLGVPAAQSQPSTATSAASAAGRSGSEDATALVAEPPTAVTTAAVPSAPIPIQRPKLHSRQAGTELLDGSLTLRPSAASSLDSSSSCSAALIGAVKSFDSAVARSLTPIKTRSTTREAESVGEPSPPAPFVEALASPFQHSLLKLKGHLAAAGTGVQVMRATGQALAPNRYDPNDRRLSGSNSVELLGSGSGSTRPSPAKSAKGGDDLTVVAAAAAAATSTDEPDFYVSVPGRRQPILAAAVPPAKAAAVAQSARKQLDLGSASCLAAPVPTASPGTALVADGRRSAAWHAAAKALLLAVAVAILASPR